MLQEVCGQIMNSKKVFGDGGSLEVWLLAMARVPLGIQPILREVEFYVYLINGQFTTNDHTSAGDSAFL